MKKKTLYWTLAVGLQIAVGVMDPLCALAAGGSAGMDVWRMDARQVDARQMDVRQMEVRQVDARQMDMWRTDTQQIDIQPADMLQIKQQLTELQTNASQGWHFLSGHWYFLVLTEGGGFSRCMTDWQWIDGYCYYFTADGNMLADTITPDGYLVDETGAWVESGQAVYRPGAGITTKPEAVQEIKLKRSGSGGSSGSGSSGRRKKPESSANKETGIEPGADVGAEAERDKNKEPEQGLESSGNEETKPDKKELFSYTIQYKDIDSKKVLTEVAGQAEKHAEIVIEHRTIDGYTICEQQPEIVRLSFDNLYESVYYQRIRDASPSNAEEISWEVRFVDAETNQKELLPARSGRIQEGSVLLVNYIEYIIQDRILWKALVQPPLEIEVQGPGNQIYYVEYEPAGMASGPEDPYAAEKQRLQDYLELAKSYEHTLTGEAVETILDERFIVSSQNENDIRIGSMISQGSGQEDYIFYVIGRNYKPNGMLIAEWFGRDTEAEYSSETEAEIRIDGDYYTVVRMSVAIKPDRDWCQHNWKMAWDYPAACCQNGRQGYQCDRCSEEMHVTVPSSGHLDEDADTICDRCGEGTETEGVVRQHWNPGDIQAQELDGQIYFFECVDQNYTDVSDQHQQVALFLCTSIIPADYGSEYRYEIQPDGTRSYVFYPGEIVHFGTSNDYKSSSVRKFLKRIGQGSANLGNTNIGVTYAFQGATEKDSYEQLQESALSPCYIGNQKMTDKMFSLSVEEALKYRTYLWNVEDTGACAKGFWLRTPMGDQRNHDTDYVYMVDIINGNIRPQRIRPLPDNGQDEETRITGTTGVRPAYTMPQR